MENLKHKPEKREQCLDPHAPVTQLPAQGLCYSTTTSTVRSLSLDLVDSQYLKCAPCKHYLKET